MTSKRSSSAAQSLERKKLADLISCTEQFHSTSVCKGVLLFMGILKQIYNAVMTNAMLRDALRGQERLEEANHVDLAFQRA